MGKTGPAFRDAWRDYRRHFRELWTASALLSLPMSLVFLVRGLVAAHAHLPLSAASVGLLGFTGTVLSALTPAAVALLAADLRAGGTWGWRQAWGRALRRAEPIVSGSVAASFVTTLCAVLVLVLLQHLRRRHDGPLWTLIVGGVSGTVVVVAMAFMALVPFVTSVGRAGGLEAVGQTWRILTRAFRGNVAALGLAQGLVYLPLLILVLIFLPRSSLTVVALLVRVYEISAMPFAALVAMSVYWDARAAGGDGAAQLRADLDAP